MRETLLPHRHRSGGSALHPIPYRDMLSALLQGETEAGSKAGHGRGKEVNINGHDYDWNG